MKCALAAALVLAAHPAAFGKDPQTVLVWGINYGPDSKGLEAVVRAFERLNPDLRVRVMNLGAGAMNPQKLMTSIVGNVSPDVINQDRFTISDWASRGAFMPLQDLIARDLARGDAYVPDPAKYYPAVWAEASYAGKVYGIPTSADNRILYYNKRLFRESEAKLRAAGLDPNRAPRTWSELIAYGKALTVKDGQGNLKQAGFLPNFGNSWLYMYAFQNNASFMSADGRRCTLYSKESEEALQFIVDGYREIAGGYERAKAFETGFQNKENDPFVIGKVAMKIDGDWILNDLSRYAPSLELGVAPPPVPDDRYYRRGRFANEKDRFVTWMGGFSYAIPAGARNPEGGWRFIKFVTSTQGRLIEAEAQRNWERRRGREFIPRLQGSREANEALYARFKPASPKFAAALRQHIDLSPYGRIRPVTFVGQVLWNEHVRALENAAMEKKAPKEALLDGQAVVQKELDAVFNAKQFPLVDLRVPAALFGGLAALAVVGLYVAYSRKRLGRLARHEARWAYLFVAPWVIGFCVFTLGPMLASFFFSFTQYDVLSPARWVGTKNFADMARSDWGNVSKAFGNVIYMAGVGVPLGIATGLSVALLLNSAVRGMRYYRTIFYMPAIVPVTASAVLWIWILTPDPNKGLINSFWQSTVGSWFGLAPPGWLNAEAWSKPALILMGLWGAGSGMILWLAGLKGVPAQLYEAASIDGASPRQQFWSVTLPQLSPIIFFNLVMGFIGALQEFDRVYVMRPASEGTVGPADSLMMPVFHLFTNGFSYFKMGYASALAWVIFTIILVVTLVQFGLGRRWVHYEAER